MSNWFVSYGKLAKVVADHVRFYVNFDEFFTVVYTDFCANHFWQDNKVAYVSFDCGASFGFFCFA